MRMVYIGYGLCVCVQQAVHSSHVWNLSDWPRSQASDWASDWPRSQALPHVLLVLQSEVSKPCCATVRRRFKGAGVPVSKSLALVMSHNVLFLILSLVLSS